MGDAAITGLSAVILDQYARAFDVQLGGTVRHAAIVPRLSTAIANGARGLNGTSGPIAVSINIVPGDAEAIISDVRLAADQQQRARAIAGSLIAQIDRKTSVALGISRSALSLAKQLDGSGRTAFLASEAADAGLGFDARAGASFALRYDLAGVHINTAAESGEIERYEPSLTPQRRDQYSLASFGADRRFGRLGLLARATYLNEQDTVLGARFDEFLGANGARTWLADVGADLRLGTNWHASAALRRGFTSIGAGGARLGRDYIRSDAWSFDISKTHLFIPRDQFALRIAQPLRVSSGGFDVTLARRYDYASQSATLATQRVNLTPKGHEVDVEALYAREVGRGLISGNVYFRRNPGHFATAPNDYGLAIRFTLRPL